LTEVARYLDEADEGLVARNKRGSTAVQMSTEHIVNLLLATGGPRATDAVAAVKLFGSLEYSRHENARREGVEFDPAPEMAETFNANFGKVLTALIEGAPALEAKTRQMGLVDLGTEVVLDFSRRRASISLRDKHETVRLFHYTVPGEPLTPRTGISKVTIFGWDVIAEAGYLALHATLIKHGKLQAFMEGRLPAAQKAPHAASPQNAQEPL
jgi:hypothetical protein